MLRGDNGILNRGAEAKFANSIAQFDDQTKLAAMAVRTSIESNKVSIPGYIATYNGTGENAKNYFTGLVNEVAKELGAKIIDAKTNSGATTKATIDTEGYTIAWYLDEGNTSKDGNGYIVIWYTDNSLRSSMNRADVIEKDGLAPLASENHTTENEAVLVTVIHVGNYTSGLSKKGITSIWDANNDVKTAEFEDTKVNDEKIDVLAGTTIEDKEQSLFNTGDIMAVNNKFILKSDGKLYTLTDYVPIQREELITENIEGQFIADNVRAICDNLYITQDNHLFEYDSNTNESKHLIENVSTIKTTYANELLFVNNSDLYYYDNENQESPLIFIADEVVAAKCGNFNSRVTAYKKNNNKIYMWNGIGTNKNQIESNTLELNDEVDKIFCLGSNNIYYLDTSNAFRKIGDSNYLIENVRFIAGGFRWWDYSDMVNRAYVLDNFGKLYNIGLNLNLYDDPSSDLYGIRIKNLQMPYQNVAHIYDYEGNYYHQMSYEDRVHISSNGYGVNPDEIQESTGIYENTIYSTCSDVQNSIENNIPGEQTENHKMFYEYSIYKGGYYVHIFLEFVDGKWYIESELVNTGGR